MSVIEGTSGELYKGGIYLKYRERCGATVNNERRNRSVMHPVRVVRGQREIGEGCYAYKYI